MSARQYHSFSGQASQYSGGSSARVLGGWALGLFALMPGLAWASDPTGLIHLLYGVLLLLTGLLWLVSLAVPQGGLRRGFRIFLLAALWSPAPIGGVGYWAPLGLHLFAAFLGEQLQLPLLLLAFVLTCTGLFLLAHLVFPPTEAGVRWTASDRPAVRRRIAVAVLVAMLLDYSLPEMAWLAVDQLFQEQLAVDELPAETEQALRAFGYALSFLASLAAAWMGARLARPNSGTALAVSAVAVNLLGIGLALQWQPAWADLAIGTAISLSAFVGVFLWGLRGPARAS